MSSANLKTKKRAKRPRPNMGISNKEVRNKLNQALDKMGLARGGHRLMHHDKPRLKS